MAHGGYLVNIEQTECGMGSGKAEAGVTLEGMGTIPREVDL